MKLKIKRNILLENLNYVSKALSNKNIIPVLNGILFELNNEGLTLIATDNDICVKTFIDKKEINEIIEEGKTILYGRFIVDILRKLSSDIINIEEIDGNKVIISTSNSKYNLNCYDVGDFPDINIKIEENPIVLNTGDFKKIVQNTSFASSLQESRPLLTGINIKIQGSYLECVATDSYRLAKMFITLNKDVNENINVIVPSKNINELIKILEDDTQEMELSVFSNKLIVKYKNIFFQSSLLNGTYPNTDNLIPNEFDIKLDVSLTDFYGVIDRASLLTLSKEKNNIKLELKGQKLIITSTSVEIGKVEEVLEIDNKDEQAIDISFSARYMLEALKTFNTEKITINMNGEIKPIIINSSEISNLTQLILPIKTF